MRRPTTLNFVADTGLKCTCSRRIGCGPAAPKTRRATSHTRAGVRIGIGTGSPNTAPWRQIGFTSWAPRGHSSSSYPPRGLVNSRVSLRRPSEAPSAGPTSRIGRSPPESPNNPVALACLHDSEDLRGSVHHDAGDSFVPAFANRGHPRPRLGSEEGPQQHDGLLGDGRNRMGLQWVRTRNKRDPTVRHRFCVRSVRLVSWRWYLRADGADGRMGADGLVLLVSSDEDQPRPAPPLPYKLHLNAVRPQARRNSAE